MSIAQTAFMPMLSKVVQSVGVELTVFVVSALVAVSFRDACLGKQTGSSKSRESLKLKLHLEEQTWSSKSPESLKLESHLVEQASSPRSPESLKLKQRDVTMTRSVTYERRQSGFQLTWAEEPPQKSQQMSRAWSGSSGEEAAKKNNVRRQVWGDEKKLAAKASIVSSDPVKDALVDKIKSFQRAGKEVKAAWITFCESQEGSKRDPTVYPVDVLQQFVQEHCPSERRSIHPWHMKKQLH